MPKVKNYAPSWLSEQSPAFDLFEPAPETRSRGLTPPYSNKKKYFSGPRRTIARRGTEVFVAVGKEIRWGDLAYLKDEWSNGQTRGQAPASGSRIKREDSTLSTDLEADLGKINGLRILKTPVADEIKQLIISPNSNYLAILTSHTVHICILPDSSHLTSEDTSPFKPKIFTLGPTTHVTSRSPVMSALWHPLGVNGSCVVTVTADAVVRVWELSLTDRWSFDSPTTSIDLPKLASGSTVDQDFSASNLTTNKGFSPDALEMKVAAASFAARGSGGWNPMTLWIAMTEGDVYALCPLLPQRWAPPPTLIPSLSVSIVGTVASIEDDPDVSEQEKLLAQQQMEWMGDLDAQEPVLVDGPPEDPLIEAYSRPSRPGAVPRLQGPFDLNADPDTNDDLDTAITDILVIGKKTETEELMEGEEDEFIEMDDSNHEGLSLAVVCLVSVSGQVRVYLDYDGVQAQWLPPRKKAKLSRRWAEAQPASLLALQAMDTLTPVEVNEESWPVFSNDVMSRYNFYVTSYAAITFISLASWVFRLEGELQGDSEAGNDFRIGLLANSQSTRERIFAPSAPETSSTLTGSCAIRDPDLGYLLLSATPYSPIALIFDAPDVEQLPVVKREDDVVVITEREQEVAPLDFIEPRPVFQPPRAFENGTSLPALLDRVRTSRHKTVVNQEVKLSPLTLQIFTDAHKVLSEETYRLGVAAAEIFRRCELLQTELKQQVTKANEVKARVDSTRGTQRDEGTTDNVMFEDRIASARHRQESLTQRVDKLRQVVGKATIRELSNREKAYVEEVQNLEASLSEAGLSESVTVRPQAQQQLWKRLENVKRLREELVDEIELLPKEEGTDLAGPSSPAVRELKVPQDIRRSKLQHVQGLLSRETALVEAVTDRLVRLQATV